MKLIIDSREPSWHSHPWRPYLPAGVEVEQRALETADFALDGAEDGAVVERKTTSDFASCLGASRARFERELSRGRYCGQFIVVVEGSLPDLLLATRMNNNAILGSLAAWTRRFSPIVFCGSAELAATLAFRFLLQPVAEAKRLIRRVDANGHRAVMP